MEMNLQLHHVVSDITGATGMRIIRAIVAGERRPDVLATYRDVRCHASMETIRASLTGNDRDEHVFSLRQSLELYDTYQSKIAECDRVLEASMAALIDEVEKPAKPLSKARVQTKQVNAPAFDVRAALYGMLGVDLDSNSWFGAFACFEARQRMRARFEGLAERQTLHVVALPCSRKQDLRRKGPFVQDATVFEPSSGVVAPGGDNRRSNRHCAWGFLSTAVVTHRQIQSRHSHGEEDRGALLQCSSSRHGIQGSWGGSL